MLRIFLLCLCLLAGLVSCLPRRQVAPISQANPIAPIEPPSFMLVDGQTAIEKFDPPGAGSQVELTIATQVSNPNEFGIRLKQVSYDIYLSNRKVTKGFIELDQFILGNAQVPLKFPVTVDLEGQLELIKAVAKAFTGTALDFRVEGISVFTSDSYEFESRPSVLVEGQTTAREPVRAPELRLADDSSSVFLVRENAPVIRAVIQAVNPGEIGYFLYGKDVSVSLNGHVLALQDVTPFPVPAGQESGFELLFYPDVSKLSQAALDAVNAALAGIPTSLDLQGLLLLDVLGVDTFSIEEGWGITGFVYNN